MYRWHGLTLVRSAVAAKKKTARRSEPVFLFLADIQPRVSNDTPSFAAITVVAPGVLFSDFAIFLAPALDFAIVFNVRTSSFVQARLITFLAISVPFFLRTGLVSEQSDLAIRCQFICVVTLGEPSLITCPLTHPSQLT
jgi:hypothetical protein